MKKLYYTCPIKAIYMMKEFGVELEFPDDDGELFDFKHCGINGESVSEFLEGVEGYPNKIYVAKDSEHIFEPKSHDVVFSQEQQFSKIHPKLHKDVITYLGGNIVMRNDKHFFMPEVENDD